MIRFPRKSTLEPHRVTFFARNPTILLTVNFNGVVCFGPCAILVATNLIMLTSDMVVYNETRKTHRCLKQGSTVRVREWGANVLLPARQVFLSRATVLVQDEDILGVARDGWYQQNIFTYHDFMKFVNMLIQLLHCSVVTSAILTNPTSLLQPCSPCNPPPCCCRKWHPKIWKVCWHISSHHLNAGVEGGYSRASAFCSVC